MSWKSTAVAAVSAALLATGGLAAANAVSPALAVAARHSAPVTHDATKSTLEHSLDAQLTHPEPRSRPGDGQVDATESAAADDSRHDLLDNHSAARPGGVSADTGRRDHGDHGDRSGHHNDRHDGRDDHRHGHGG